MNIGELARQADVTPRTVRYYVEQGLLPPPERGYPAEYTEEHASLLELIKLLKDERMPLEEIKATIRRLAAGEVRELLARARERAAARPLEQPDSAADYISRVLESSSRRDALLESHARKHAGPMPAQLGPEPAVMAATPQAPAPPQSAAPARPVAPPAADQYSTAQVDVQDAGTWQRIRLTPGVEIHYQLTAGGEQRNLVDRLVELAARMLGHGPEKES